MQNFPCVNYQILGISHGHFLIVILKGWTKLIILNLVLELVRFFPNPTPVPAKMFSTPPPTSQLWLHFSGHTIKKKTM